MRNPAVCKNLSGGVDGVFTLVALSVICSWMMLSVNARVVVSEYNLVDSHKSQTPHRSLQRRDVLHMVAKEVSDKSSDSDWTMEDESLQTEDVPTIIPGFCGDPDTRAKNLSRTFHDRKGAKSIIAILSNCTRAERQKIRASYEAIYDEDLVDRMDEFVSSRFPENFAELVYELATSLPELLASRFKKAVDKNDFNAIRQVLTPLNGFEIDDMADIFHDVFMKDITEHQVGSVFSEMVKDTVYPKLRRIIDSQLQVLRNFYDAVNHRTADIVADLLVEERKSGAWINEDSAFHMTLMIASFPQLRLIGRYFKELSGVSLAEAITDAFDENGFKNPEAGKAYAAIVQYAEDKFAYFARNLKTAVQNRNHESLIFIVAWRADIDLGSIKRVYRDLYNVSLYDDVEKCTSGKYRDLMLAVIRK